jgi:hypothetical protein
MLHALNRTKIDKVIHFLNMKAVHSRISKANKRKINAYSENPEYVEYVEIDSSRIFN